MSDFILPEIYTKNVIDITSKIESNCNIDGYFYRFNIILTKEIEKKGFFGKKSLILKEEKYTIAVHKSNSLVLRESIKNLNEFKRMVSYAEAIRDHIKKKKEGNNFNKLIDEGNEAIISPHQFVKDAFILKVVEELKKYNAKNV